MTSQPVPAAEAVQSVKVRTESGSELVVNIAKRAAARRVTEIDVPDQFRDVGAEAKGKLPFMQSGKPRVYMYRGWQESLVPEERIAWFLKRGFTTEPTRVAPLREVPCGVFLTELGRPCTKMLINFVERLHHIRQSHAELAPWVLTEEDHKRIRGDMNIPNPTDLDNTAKLAELEGRIDRIIELLERGEGKAAAQDLEDIKVAIDAINVGDHPQDIISEEPPAAHLEHIPSCHTKGRFGKYTEGCVACSVALSKKQGSV